MDNYISTFEKTGKLPDVVEETYVTLLSMYRNKDRNTDKQEQRYMTFMADNYFKVKHNAQT